MEHRRLTPPLCASALLPAAGSAAAPPDRMGHGDAPPPQGYPYPPAQSQGGVTAPGARTVSCVDSAQLNHSSSAAQHSLSSNTGAAEQTLHHHWCRWPLFACTFCQQPTTGGYPVQSPAAAAAAAGSSAGHPYPPPQGAPYPPQPHPSAMEPPSKQPQMGGPPPPSGYPGICVRRNCCVLCCWEAMMA